MPWLHLLFQIVLFGTLAETAAGFIKALEDRIERAFFPAPHISAESAGRHSSCARCERPFELAQPLITGAVAALGVCASTFGLTRLVDKGYGAICYGALLLFALPMLTAGAAKLRRNRGR